MLEIIEYNLKFKYENIDKYLWVDNFQVDDYWEIVRLKAIRTIQKSFMDRSPFNEPKKDYDIAIYSQNKWYTLKDNIGETITMKNEKPIIPNLKIKSYILNPIESIYKIDADFHILITILNQNEKIKVIEFKKPSLKEAVIIYENLKIKIFGNVISYRGENQDKFKKFCIKIKNIYSNEYKEIENIFSKLSLNYENPNLSHKSLAYKTWNNAKRQNQNEWPKISLEKKENSIEFPKNSGIHYYYEGKFVGLAKRSDHNSQIFIPKIYTTNHKNNKNTYLYKFINNINNNNKIKIPHTLRSSNISSKNFKNLRIIKEKENEKYLEVDYKGNIIETDLKPDVIVYRDIIIKILNKIEKKSFEINIIPKAQILDENNKMIMYLDKNNNWVKYNSPKIRNIITLPYNYKQIIHDYNKLKRLKDGPLMSLDHIGIIDENSNDIITAPIKNYKDLYISKSLETKRLTTLKYNKNSKIKIIYDKNLK